MTWIRFVKAFLWSSGLLLTLMAATATLLAQAPIDAGQYAVPEIDGTTVGSAVACLVGGYLMLLSRFRHKR